MREGRTTTERRCPECGCLLCLYTGRRSSKCYYVHRGPPSDCIHDQVGYRLHFNSREEAEKSEIIFTHQYQTAKHERFYPIT